MPATSPTGQPGDSPDWFGTAAGQALALSEETVVEQALGERPGQPWLWLAPAASATGGGGRGLRLSRSGGRWRGTIVCAAPFPLPGDCFATVVMQHVLTRGGEAGQLLEEAARLLVPGGRLWLLLLNPVAPYRWRWRGSGLAASEPLFWRRRLRACGLEPDPISFGVGPIWKPRVSPELQNGPGMRAAYVLRAERRVVPLTPVRRRGRVLHLSPAA